MRFLVSVFLSILFFSSVAVAAEGVRVYVNGKDVTGKRHIKLKNVSVRFDSLGNVHVGAPTYTVKPPIKPGSKEAEHAKASSSEVAATLAKAKAAAAKGSAKSASKVAEPKKEYLGISPNKQYFVRIDRKDAAILGCKVDIVIDGRVVGQVGGQGKMKFKDITSGLVQGPAKLVIRIRRPPNPNVDSKRVSREILRDAYLGVTLGSGSVSNGKLTFEQVVGQEVRCTDRTGGYVERVFPINVE